MKSERALLYTLAAAQFTHIMDFMIIMPLVEVLSDSFAITPREFSFIVSSYTYSAGIFSFLGAFIINRFDRKTALLFAYAGFTIGTFACAFSPSYITLLTARIITGAFGGILGALVLSIIGDAIPNERRAGAMGTVMAAFSLAAVAGVPLGLQLQIWFDSWEAPFLFIGGASMIIMVFMVRNIPSMRGHIESRISRTRSIDVLGNVVKSSNQILALLLMVLLVIGQFSIIPFITKYMINNVGFTQKEIPLIYLVGGALTAFSSPLIGRLADRYGRNRIFLILATLSMISFFFITTLPPVGLGIALAVNASFFVFVSGRWVPATTMLTSVVEPGQRGSFMSISTSVRQLSSGAAAMLTGYIVYESSNGALENYHIVGWIAIGTTVLAMLISGRLKIVD